MNSYVDNKGQAMILVFGIMCLSLVTSFNISNVSI